MSGVEVGQVLSLRIRFNNIGTISQSKHPYLIVDVDQGLGVVEIAQLDSLKGKEHKAIMRSNKVIFCHDPDETVIDKDSYIQKDNTIKIEDCPELLQFRRQPDKLSPAKLADVLKSYRKYHKEYMIDENKNVYIDKNELLRLNP